MTPTIYMLIVLLNGVPTPTGFWPSLDECVAKADEGYSVNYARQKTSSSAYGYCLPVPAAMAPKAPQ
jgi:hypothetical protein